MSILRNFARWGRTLWNPSAGGGDCHCTSSKVRISRFEQLEERKPLTANPFPDIHLGSTYLEPASGDDSSPNVIQIIFQGGAPGTQLTQIVINGDKDGNGQYSSGEVFFDTAPGGQGVFSSQPFHVIQSNGFTVTGAQVTDGGQQLVINLQNFVAGDKLIFSIDVDEVQFVPSDGSAPDVNAVVEGNEFQRSILTGAFVAPHYQNISGQALYWDDYDPNFAAANTATGTTLDLPSDSYVPPLTSDDSDFTAGAVLQLHQLPLPDSISGTVYHDKNLDNLLDNNEQGIANVKLTLLVWDGTQFVSTGRTTTTDGQGNYKFTNVDPGKYLVAETQPAGWLSVGSQPGTVDGVVDGTSQDVDDLSNIVLLGGQDGVHYNFGECLPASVSGKVWNDTNGDCVYEPDTDIPLSGVQIDLRDSSGNVVATTTTDQQGNYQFINLVPGTYSVFEHQPAGYLEGMDMTGTVDGAAIGTHGGTDLLSQIVLGSGATGIHYDFCELLPASLSGKVWNDRNGDCVYEPGTDIPLSGVQIDLRDADGAVVATTLTDDNGNYKFDNLTPGTYSVFEHQPAGYEEGMDML
ncbi:MAG TPA: SdrD B-like domain-containing protein, partial [Pirellulales bacterium]